VNWTISRADFSSLLNGAGSPLLFKRNAIHIGHRGHRACSKCISRVHFLIDLGSIFWDTNCQRPSIVALLMKISDTKRTQPFSEVIIPLRSAPNLQTA
jgi:hypothetical protein